MCLNWAASYYWEYLPFITISKQMPTIWVPDRKCKGLRFQHQEIGNNTSLVSSCSWEGLGGCQWTFSVLESLSQTPLSFTQKLGLSKCYIFRVHWHKISKKLMLLTTGSCSNCEFSTISSSKLSSNPMNVSFLISLNMMFEFDVQFSAVKPDGGVFDDQLGDLVGPEDVPVQLLHIAIHNRQVLDFPSRPVGVKVWKVWKEWKIWKVWKVKRKSENLRSPTAMLARLVFSQRTAMPWEIME